MDVERWRREWGSADRTDGLVLFPPAWFEDASLEREDVHLLTEGGLPADAAPFLSFGPSDNGFLRGIREAGLAPLHTDRF